MGLDPMLRQLFSAADIPTGRAILVHARLRGLHKHYGATYQQLSQQLLHQLLSYNPQLLLIPCYTIYSFLSGGVFQRELSHSEVGRFSEELRIMKFSRTSDPMYSVLDILNRLPAGLRYDATFGTKSVCDHLYRNNAIIINIDMPGFYATPIHQLELNANINYRHIHRVNGHIQCGSGNWQPITYQAYLRNIANNGAVYPPYNQQRRQKYLIEKGVIHATEHNGITLQWAELNKFQNAITDALNNDINFLIDQTGSPRQ